jgi:hypothetical protein
MTEYVFVHTGFLHLDGFLPSTPLPDKRFQREHRTPAPYTNQILLLYLNVRGSCSQSYPPHHQVRSQLCYSITKILISSACFKSHLIFISPVITCSGPDAQCHRSIHACTTLPAELQHGTQTVSYTNSRKNESFRNMPVATKTSRKHGGKNIGDQENN